jgi:hypothetical protein
MLPERHADVLPLSALLAADPGSSLRGVSGAKTGVPGALAAAGPAHALRLRRVARYAYSSVCGEIVAASADLQRVRHRDTRM